MLKITQEKHMFRVEAVKLGMDQKARSPVLILKKENSDEAFVLALSHLEAAGIAAVLRGEEGKRPATHHLFGDFLRYLGYRVLRAEVRDLHGKSKRARLLLGSDLEGSVAMEAGASDAVAMALCFDAPIFLSVEALQNPVENSGKIQVMDQSPEGEKWAAFLESLDADRFGHA